MKLSTVSFVASLALFSFISLSNAAPSPQAATTTTTTPTAQSPPLLFCLLTPCSTVAFLPDFTNPTQGPLKNRGLAFIDYSRSRNKQCPPTDSAPDVETRVYYQFEGDEKPEEFTYSGRWLWWNQIPLKAGRLNIWFKNTRSDGCVSWDSNFGKNWQLNIPA
ncbi:hypothetical protein HK102_008851 [Quaeritorhiza haematococci]|nr:hypothetical protein HK102_008851 [Quaeritorhiza haematococci]